MLSQTSRRVQTLLRNSTIAAKSTADLIAFVVLEVNVAEARLRARQPRTGCMPLGVIRKERTILWWTTCFVARTLLTKIHHSKYRHGSRFPGSSQHREAENSNHEEDQNAKSLHFCCTSQHTYKRVFRGGDGNELRSGERFPLQRTESRSKSIISLTHIKCVRHSGHCSPIRKTDDVPPPIRVTQD